MVDAALDHLLHRIEDCIKKNQHKMKFKIGQEITPKIKSDQWDIVSDHTQMPMPEYGKVYTVRSYPLPKYPEMLVLCEMPGDCLYLEDNFEAVVENNQLQEDLHEVLIKEDHA